MISNIYNINPDYIYIYTRVSTKPQANDLNGLEEQDLICTSYIQNNKLNNIKTFHYTDIGSSYNEKNKLTQLNKLVKNLVPNSLILVRDISRLGRNIFQVFNLLRKIKKLNSYVIGINENLCYNYSKLMDKQFSYCIIDSEWHSDLKSVKITNRINNIKKYGGYIGRTPYGTHIIKKNNIPYLYKNEKEIDIIKKIGKLFFKYMNISHIVNYLNKNNMLNRKNTLWTDKKILSIVKKYFYIDNKHVNLVNKIFNKYKSIKN